MADIAHAKTDQKLEEMERRLSAIYSRAEKEIQKTADEYFARFAKQDEAKRKLVEQGKITEDEYKKWRKGKVMYGKRFTDTCDLNKNAETWCDYMRFSGVCADGANAIITKNQPIE